jgi:hypothetical protein
MLSTIGNNTFSNKSSFYSAFPSYLNGYIVFASHQVRSLIHHIEYNYAFLDIDVINKNNSNLIKMS